MNKDNRMKRDDEDENIERVKDKLRLPTRNKTTRFREKSTIAKRN